MAVATSSSALVAEMARALQDGNEHESSQMAVATSSSALVAEMARALQDGDEHESWQMAVATSSSALAAETARALQEDERESSQTAVATSSSAHVVEMPEALQDARADLSRRLVPDAPILDSWARASPPSSSSSSAAGRLAVRAEDGDEHESSQMAVASSSSALVAEMARALQDDERESSRTAVATSLSVHVVEMPEAMQDARADLSRSLVSDAAILDSWARAIPPPPSASSSAARRLAVRAEEQGGCAQGTSLDVASAKRRRMRRAAPEEEEAAMSAEPDPPSEPRPSRTLQSTLRGWLRSAAAEDACVSLEPDPHPPPRTSEWGRVRKLRISAKRPPTAHDVPPLPLSSLKKAAVGAHGMAPARRKTEQRKKPQHPQQAQKPPGKTCRATPTLGRRLPSARHLYTSSLFKNSSVRVLDFRVPAGCVAFVCAYRPMLRLVVESVEPQGDGQCPGVPLFLEAGHTWCFHNCGSREFRQIVVEFLRPPTHSDEQIRSMKAKANFPTDMGRRLRFENAFCRAWDLNLPPQQQHDVRQHILSYMLVFTTASRMRGIHPDGAPGLFDHTYEDNQVVWKPAPEDAAGMPAQAYGMQNGSADRAMGCLLVEVK